MKAEEAKVRLLSDQIENSLFMKFRKVIHEEISSHAQNFYNQIGVVVSRLDRLESSVQSYP